VRGGVGVDSQAGDVRRPWQAVARVLAMPGLFALVDLLARIQIASLLELNHESAARAAALGSAGIGVLRDLACVMPAYVAFALAPRAATRRLTHVVLGVATLILAGDLGYFYFTLEHVEPVLFVNVNLLSLGGTLEARSAATAALAALGALALVRLNARLLSDAHTDFARPLATLALAGGCLAPLLPLAVVTQPVMPAQQSAIEQFLDRTRNASLRKVSAPIVANLFTALAASRHLEKPAPPLEAVAYTPEETEQLRDLRLLDADAPGPAATAVAGPEIRRIVIVILESLAAAYLHSENAKVPAEATAYLDSLLARFPHFERFYTSNMPSDWGLNSLLLSRLEPDWGGGRPSLLSLLRERAGFESFYVRAVSKHYGNELYTYPRMFQMDHYIAGEELAERYESHWHSAWGFNDAVVYEEGVRILREHRDDKVVVILNTIDLHQPGPFQGVPFDHLPDALKRQNVGLYNALYWTDQCVSGLFTTLEQENLFDDHTLVVLTADHTPHPGVEYRDTVPPEEYVRLGRLPLVFAMRDPARLRGLDTGAFASQVDVTPTVLALLGVPKPRGMVGRSLFGPDASRFAVGVYRDTFYYHSESSSFEEALADAGTPPTLRAQALRKWLHNLDVELPSSDASRTALATHR